MSKKAALILVSVIFAVCVGLIVYGFVTQPENIKNNLPRVGIVVIGFVAAVFKITGKGGSSRGLAFYEKAYNSEIGDAFSEDKEGKKKLLTALKYFNENKYEKAINILTELSKSSRGLKERSVCGLFIGTCYSDSGREQKAIEHYEGLIEMRLENDTICNNLGLLYEENGRPDKAVELFEKAISINPDTDVAYSNLADIRFDEEKFDEAITLAETALSKNANLREPANLLAVIYSIKGDKESADKYYRMSVKNGQDGANLKLAMSHYKNLYDESNGADEDEEA